MFVGYGHSFYSVANPKSHLAGATPAATMGETLLWVERYCG